MELVKGCNPAFEKYLGEEEKLGLSVSKSLSLEFPHVVSKTLKMKLNFQFELIVKWYVQRNKQTWCWEALKACLCHILWQAKERE